MVGASIGVLHEAFKIAHTYTSFWRKKIFMDLIQFSHYDFWIFSTPYILYAYYAERKFCHKYTRALSPVWNRPHIYAHYTREKFRPQIYIRIAVRLEFVSERLIEHWYLCVRLYHVCICGHRLDKVVFFDWSMSKFDCKSVTRFHKFIVKMWLCRCNCMCICVCIWCWSWFCCRLDWAVVRL